MKNTHKQILEHSDINVVTGLPRYYAIYLY